MEKINAYKCSDCSFKFISFKKVHSCPICNKKVEDIQENKVLYPEKIIVFNSSIDVTNIVKTKLHINAIKNRIKKLYIPVLILNFKMEGDLDLIGTVESEIKNGSNKYVKSDTYEIKTEGSADFNNYIISLSKKIDNKLLNKVLPYDLSKLEKYEIKDEIFEYYKYNIRDVNVKTNELFLKLFEEKLHNYKKVLPKRMDFKKDGENIVYTLIPIYTLNVNNKLIIINGQNGKISEEIKLSKLKKIFISLFTFLIVFAIIFLVYYVVIK